MKRILYLILLGMMALSCVSEQQEDISTPADDTVFHASFDNGGTPDSKAFADEQLRGRWDVGDHISIFNKNTINREYAFQGQTGDNSGTFKKVPSEDFYAGNPLDYVYAVYPFSESTSISDEGELTVYLPAVQTYRENSFGLGANTMIAVAEEDELLFKNLCGYFAVKLYGDDVTVRSITLRGNDEELLAGKASVIAELDSIPALTFDSAVATKAVTLIFDSPVTLGSSAEAATDFWFVIPPVSFEAGITLSVTDIYGRMFSKATTGKLEIKRNTLKHSAALQVVPTTPEPEAVDLGLSVKWASFNLGASAPEEYGNYYAWGELLPKASYDWESYKWYDTYYTKYDEYKTTLELEDDAAHASLGGAWCIPSNTHLQELIDNCTAEWTTENGVNGTRFTSNKEGYTDKSIFIPAAGYYSDSSLFDVGSCGYCWASTIQVSGMAVNLEIGGSWSRIYRRSLIAGASVRPVYLTSLISSIQLSPTSTTIFAGSSKHLVATILPENASRKDLAWTSSDESVIKVDSKGNIHAIAQGSAVITAAANDGSGIYATCTVTVTEAGPPVPEAVDMGLSVKWASFNLGGAMPEDYGCYYAWGELIPKPNYYQGAYKWYNGRLTKYNLFSDFGIVDNKYILDPEDDAAHVYLGDAWYMPTTSEIDELINNCTAEWTTENGISGLRLTSTKEGYTDRSIFLPAAGVRNYSSFSGDGTGGAFWSSEITSGDYASQFSFGFNSVVPPGIRSANRWRGRTIRPVYITTPATSIQISNTSSTLHAGETLDLEATVLPENASRKIVSWASSDESVATIEPHGEYGCSVSAHAPGSSTITATAIDGSGVTATCLITVIDTVDIWKNDTAGSFAINGTYDDEGKTAGADGWLKYENGAASWTANDTGTPRSATLTLSTGSIITITQLEGKDFTGTWNVKSRLFNPNLGRIDRPKGTTNADSSPVTISAVSGTVETLEGHENAFELKGLYGDATMKVAIEIDYEAKDVKMGLFFDKRTTQLAKDGVYCAFIPELESRKWGGYNFAPSTFGINDCNYEWMWCTCEDFNTFRYRPHTQFITRGTSNMMLIGISIQVSDSWDPTTLPGGDKTVYNTIYQANYNSGAPNGTDGEGLIICR